MALCVLFNLCKVKRIVFLGAKPVAYRCLDFLLKNEISLDAKVIAVLTNDTKMNDPAFDIGTLCQQNETPILKSLDELPQSDLLISIQYREILKKHHIETSKLAINLHMAPLPEYRGCNQFSFAIANGDKEFGTTIHELVEKIDGGDIIAESRFTIPGDCFVNELFELTAEKSVTLFEQEIGNILSGNFSRVPQQTLIDERGTSYNNRTSINSLKEIDLNWDREKIERHIRATSMPGYEPPFAIIGERRVSLTIQANNEE